MNETSKLTRELSDYSPPKNHCGRDDRSLYDGIISKYASMMNKLIAEPRLSFSKASSDNVPDESGVYTIFDKRTERIIYAGRTKNLRRRLLSNHRTGNIRGSQFRRALQKKFALKSESDISGYIQKTAVSSS
jgi:hypothetical protein